MTCTALTSPPFGPRPASECPACGSDELIPALGGGLVCERCDWHSVIFIDSTPPEPASNRVVKFPVSSIGQTNHGSDSKCPKTISEMRK